jgi:aspartyl-tRNA(Asn)/glutamyl-tRNA(Gln) amidotransferase subunit A
MYLSDVYTVNANIAGICGISIPCGFADVGGKRLPIGLQLQCQAFDEATMFRIARMFEKARVV